MTGQCDTLVAGIIQVHTIQQEFQSLFFAHNLGALIHHAGMEVCASEWSKRLIPSARSEIGQKTIH